MLDSGGSGGAIGKAVGMVAMAAPAVAGSPAPAQGSGFMFKADELTEVIRQWEDLRDSLKSDERDAELMAHVEPPGREFASDDFTRYANPSGKAFLAANKRMQEYVAEYIEALKSARDRITTRDEQARAEVSRAGEQQA